MASTTSQSKNKKYVMSIGLKIITFLFFTVFVIIPLINVFLHIDKDSLTSVLSSSQFSTALINSLTTGLLSTAITLVISYFLAVCVERSGIKKKELWSTLLIIPMLIPSISHGMGLIVLFGNNGFITNLFKLNSNIYGFGGIVAGSVMYAFPVAFLMLRDILKYEDKSPYEAAQVLGISKVRQFFSITLPYITKPLISVTFAVFTMVVTDYGVPLMIGGKFTTIPVIMYQEVIGQLDFGKGSVYAIILLIPAVITFLFDLLQKDKGNSSFVTKEFDTNNKKMTTVTSYIYCSVIIICVILPIVAFMIMGFANYYPDDLSFSMKSVLKTMDMGAGEYFINSLIIATVVSVIGMIISFITAYFTARMPAISSKVLHLIAITSAAIPGIVLGLAYVMAFKSAPFYGTLIILIMVNTIHFISSPYLMMYNCLNKINQNLEPVGDTLGISRLRMIKDVIIPQCKISLCEVLSYFFINCMITISAVSFLSTYATKPLSLMINEFEAQMSLECAAIVSIVILIANIIFKLIFSIIKKKITNNEIRITENI
ncbi:MAG: ABC transporter permease subunit [Acutalibacteraceae bacterium]|nr:ABC transporter permease subunit [Acutalibacteraceae bacterium]